MFYFFYTTTRDLSTGTIVLLGGLFESSILIGQLVVASHGLLFLYTSLLLWTTSLAEAIKSFLNECFVSELFGFLFFIDFFSKYPCSSETMYSELMINTK